MITISNKDLPTFLQTPFNPVTGREFTGSNINILKDAATNKDYTSSEWATLKQWNSHKETIALNQKGTKITFRGKNGPEQAVVFNRCQLVTFEQS